jgi:hypothetical protein
MTARVQPECVSVLEAEVITGRSQSAWRKDAYARRIESYKIGRLLRIPLTEVRRVMREGHRPRVVAEAESR